ncbi:hypothetical protein JCM15548_12397 [Geofilum rubicundum JCM 15548]|uniref:Outer membrane lipoprotein-sorting protein n=2 Tax=Geofilum TaxID=1236988 RepID=A0A0E9LY13_9BACT|nr:hypothetical protein JCM15548_12397 [Geofilum rubicundum JCM 15548]
MKYTLLAFTMFGLAALAQAKPTAEEIIQKVDDNLSSDNRIMETSITIHGRRSSRTLTLKHTP